MKKQLTAITAAMFAMTALAAPAKANDAVRLGVGILGLVINEAAKGGKGRSAERRPGRGDTMIGRVGEAPAQRRGSASRKAGAVAAGTAVAALALPETGPAIEWRPDPASIVIADAAEPTVGSSVDDFETASTEAPLSSSSLDQDNAPAPVVAAGPVELSDENGIYWGTVDGATAEKIDAAEKLGMKRSQAIVALSGLPMPEQAKADGAYQGYTAATAEAQPEPAKPAQSVVEAVPAPAVIETPAQAPAVIQQAATAPVVAAEPQKVVADIDPDVIDQGKTAAVAIEQKAPPAPEKPVKPKLDIDL